MTQNLTLVVRAYLGYYGKEVPHYINKEILRDTNALRHKYNLDKECTR